MPAKKKSYSRKKSSSPGRAKRKSSKKTTKKSGPTKAQVRNFMRVKYQTEEE